MKQKILLLHGWGGSDFPHWQSWLAGELAKDYNTVSFLKLSNFEMPELHVWKEELQAHLSDFQPDIVVCHSLANILWFHLCHDASIEQVSTLYLVAPPSLECTIGELQSFFPLEAPKNLYAKEVLLITSTNDPYMNEDEANALQKQLGVAMNVLQNGGHINAQSGFGPWEWMLKELKTKI